MSLRLLTLAALCAFAACKRAPSSSDSAGTIASEVAKNLAAITASCASATGDVQVRRGGEGEWQPVATGAVFRPGDVVRTGTGSFARVEFLAGGRLELEQNAQIVIHVAPPPTGSAPGSPAQESRVSVEAGVVRGLMSATPGSAPLVVRTAEGREVRLAAKPGEKPVAVRLTRGARGTEIFVTAGELRLVGDTGETTLHSGQAAEVGPSSAPDVVELLDFPVSTEPGVDARFLFSRDLAVRLSWKPVGEATGYRVQIARDLSFEGVEQAFDVESTEATFLPRAEGAYAWRVASRDSMGRYGEYGFARRIYCEREQPQDLLIGPSDGAVVKISESPIPVEFTWQSAANAQSYRLVIASGPDLLADQVKSLDTSAQRLEVTTLEPGAYHWGVYVRDARAQAPIFVHPRRLTVQKVAKPKVTVPRAIREWGN